MSRLMLVVRSPTYYSTSDELFFFNWLRSIAAVGLIVGSGRHLHIKLLRQPGDGDLRELLAAFFRYKVDMKPLAALRTKRNAKWFYENPEAFWHKKVFGSAKAD